MYRIVHTLYCTAVPEHCIVVLLRRLNIRTIYLGLRDTSRNARFVRNCERTANGRGEVSPLPAPRPVFAPLHSHSILVSSPNLLLACSLHPALPCPIQTS
ncbi:hypothetical protein CPAR01_02565 [Colletotrichum paranaense]|uniref:Uncharacterized protein n=5 Tax=Colletotrichum acutatum species complex TaxID=2707335 RepID=A0A9Q8SEL2_9PEZI|nr:uncharacterized protein CLUP02_02219 [Colletotrichum lupini]XP_060318319.1 uncharacterized protein CCOS01_03871 [Colletotrichum costaricense]XP_060354180.1 uncharacterized protein CPAR01_02565 [Colletotrichum paranaense]KAI3540230.1 hypothetical protein CSPX01_08419 [Colletotrichum filicis]KAK0380785.1 hypothetical protein CLIM01_01860 [Colletotrichum limetticola]KAK1460269.1 hypothetical protein CMEL01_03268 [Colletotrichum melonis]KAK1535119.1 hypothetical protein CCOS01_03871 [Colletotr